jgi:type I restriction enzyme R subunit
MIHKDKLKALLVMPKLPNLLELKYKAIADAKRELGEIKSIREAFIGFQEYLYSNKVG